MSVAGVPPLHETGEPELLLALTLEHFAERTGERFQLSERGGVLELELLSAAPAGSVMPGARMAFSIVFLGPADPVLSQRIYLLEHAALGRLALFLVPIARDARGTRYEAVFS